MCHGPCRVNSRLGTDWRHLPEIQGNVGAAGGSALAIESREAVETPTASTNFNLQGLWGRVKTPRKRSKRPRFSATIRWQKGKRDIPKVIFWEACKLSGDAADHLGTRCNEIVPVRQSESVTREEPKPCVPLRRGMWASLCWSRMDCLRLKSAGGSLHPARDCHLALLKPLWIPRLKHNSSMVVCTGTQLSTTSQRSLSSFSCI